MPEFPCPRPITVKIKLPGGTADVYAEERDTAAVEVAPYEPSGAADAAERTVVEMQGEWIAAALTGSLRLPSVERMWPAIDRAERRTRERFPEESARSIRCDPHAYRRRLHQDLRRARCRRLRSTVEDPAVAVRDESARVR